MTTDVNRLQDSTEYNGKSQCSHIPRLRLFSQNDSCVSKEETWKIVVKNITGALQQCQVSHVEKRSRLSGSLKSTVF